MKKFLTNIIVLLLVVAFAYAAFIIMKRHQAIQAQSAPQTMEIPVTAASLHAQALQGTISFVPPEQLGMSLINAGFPHERSNLNLSPRANLVGTAMAQVGNQLLSQSFYTMDINSNAGSTKLSFFLFPRKSLFDPDKSMTKMKLQHQTFYSATVNGLSVILWTRGNWYSVIVTDLQGAQLSNLMSFCLSAEEKIS